MKKSKKLIAMLLTLMMLLSILPVAAFADSMELTLNETILGVQVESMSKEYTYEITIEPSGYLTVDVPLTGSLENDLNAYVTCVAVTDTPVTLTVSIYVNGGFWFSSSDTYILKAPHTHVKNANKYHAAVAATCEADGTVEYWECTGCDKLLDKDAKELASIVDSENPALGHDFSGTLVQGENENAGKHAALCKNGCGTYGTVIGEVQTKGWVDCVCDQTTNTTHQVSPATCTTAELCYKTCVCGYCDENETFENGSPNGHSYGDVSCEWSGDSCTATRVCSACTEGTDGHSISETKTGTYVKDTNATCLAAETGHYAVTFDDPQFGTAQTDADSVTKGEPLEHSYTGEVRANNDGTHSFKCVNGCGEYGGTVPCVDEKDGGDGKCDDCGEKMKSDSLCDKLMGSFNDIVKLISARVFWEKFKPAAVIIAIVRSLEFLFK